MHGWDQIDITDWSRAYDPQPFVLSCSTNGCSCCSDSDTIRGKEEAIKVVQDWIQDQESGIAWWKEWLKKMETSDIIVSGED